MCISWLIDHSIGDDFHFLQSLAKTIDMRLIQIVWRWQKSVIEHILIPISFSITGRVSTEDLLLHACWMDTSHSDYNYSMTDQQSKTVKSMNQYEDGPWQF